jgi:hypothetical protein
MSRFRFYQRIDRQQCPKCSGLVKQVKGKWGQYKCDSCGWSGPYKETMWNDPPKKRKNVRH